MTKYKHILFDMDGTLVDSEGGIIESLHHTLRMLNHEELEEAQVRKFLGPPLAMSFKNNCNMDDAAAKDAVKIFRNYYSEYGVNNVILYPQIKSMLSQLAQMKVSLYIATSKPTQYAIKIAHTLGIAEYFIDIVGSNLDNTRGEKAEVIQYIIDTYHLENTSSLLMVGDKSHDLIGAKKCGIDAVGVTYGYGAVDELEQENPEFIIHSIGELTDIIGGTNEEN